MKQLRDSSSQERMIQQQLVERGVTDGRVLHAMRTVVREEFFPAQIKAQAHADRAAPIGHGQTISQPYIVGLMTQRLELRPSHRVLEIGTGTGYQTAILSQLAGEVFTIERVKPLLDDAFERLLALGFRNVHFRYGDGTMGWPEQGRFDRILIAAGAPEMPRKLLLSQLADGGLAVLPIGPEERQVLVLVKRNAEELEMTEICNCKFVKLIGAEGWEDR